MPPAQQNTVFQTNVEAETPPEFWINPSDWFTLWFIQHEERGLQSLHSLPGRGANSTAILILNLKVPMGASIQRFAAVSCSVVLFLDKILSGWDGLHASPNVMC